MKVITLWQPWATLVALGVKVHETRSWSTKYRGPLAIHAAKRPMDQDGRRLLDDLYAFELVDANDVANAAGFLVPHGAIVCTVNLVSVEPARRVSRRYVGYVDTHLADKMCGDFDPGRFAWRLGNVRRCDVPHKGTQGIRDLPEHTARLVREATQGT